MAVSEATSDTATSSPEDVIQAIPRDYLEQVTTACDRFLQWERNFILKREPSPKDRQQHRETLKWLLRLTRSVHLTVADPEFPDPAARDCLEHLVWRLEQSWKMIYEPMPEAEADRLFAEIFPDAPGA